MDGAIKILDGSINTRIKHVFSLCLFMLNLLMLGVEYSGFGINAMPADALTPKVARASADILLAVHGRQHALLFENWFHRRGWSQIQGTIQNVYI